MVNYINTQKWTFLICSKAVGNAHIPISHAHIHYGRLPTYYWYISKTSYILEQPTNRKLYYLLCHPILRLRSDGWLSKTFAGAKVQQIFDICKKNQKII